MGTILSMGAYISDDPPITILPEEKQKLLEEYFTRKFGASVVVSYSSVSNNPDTLKPELIVRLDMRLPVGDIPEADQELNLILI